MNIGRLVSVLAILLLTHSTESSAVESEAAEPARAPDLDSVLIELQEEVAHLRGLPFKAAVSAGVQSPEGFAGFLDRQIDEAMPEMMNRHYGAIVNRLGLYNGPLTNFRDTAKAVMSSQVAAYYDPKTQTFYSLMQNMPEPMLHMLYTHELYHGLQDQYFGLEKYLPTSSKGEPALNSDQTMARQAVVEGEATYIMNMYMMKQMAGKEPTRELMAPAVRLQSQMDMAALGAMMKLPEVTKIVGGSAADAIAAGENIPAFIMESMLGVYLKGLAFVFAVQEQGWSEVAKLYTEYPPQSTEHILHPEKWQAREAPSDIAFPELEKVAALKEWELLTTDVVGELQWRLIFAEQGLGADAESAAAGWDGDRYLIFKRKDSDATLMLMSTSWDSPAQAEEFASAYARLLAKKYVGAAEPTRVVRKKENVYIVEGGAAKHMEALLKVVTKSTKRKS